MHLCEIGGELGLCKRSRANIRMWRHHLTPRLHAVHRRPLSCLPFRAVGRHPLHLGETRAHHFALQLVHFRRLFRRGYSAEQPLNRVQCAQRVIGAEDLLMRPAVANLLQLTEHPALCFAEFEAKEILPIAQNDGDYASGVPFIGTTRHMSPGVRALFEILLRFCRTLAAVTRVHLLDDERAIARDEAVEDKAYTFTI